MDVVLDIHSWFRWAVLVALLAVGVLGVARSIGKRAEWRDGSDRPFALATVMFDVQLALGIILWIGNKGWEQSFFVKVIHPVGMLFAAGVAHMALVRARKGPASSAYRIAGLGLVVALVIVAVTIPRDAWF